MTPEQIEAAIAEVSAACEGKSHGELVGVIAHIDILRHEQGKLIDSLTNRLVATSAVADAAIEQLRSDGRAIPYELAEAYMAVTANAQSKIAKQNREHIQHSITVGVKEQRKAQARKAADVLHNKEGGSRDLKEKIRAAWATGKFINKNVCADQEWEYLKFKTRDKARECLVNEPDPNPWPAKVQALEAKQKAKGKKK